MGSISKAVRRVIPKEIQPILPIAASMFGGPLVGKFLGTGIMSTLGGKALASGLTSAGVDLLTKGKVDPRTAAVSALMGGGGQYFKNVGQGGQFLGMELGKNAKSAFTDLGSLLAPTEINDGKFQLASGIPEDEVLGSLAKSAGTAATAGGTISAYDAAEEAQRKYEEEMAGREADAAADRQSRIDYITRYMGMAGFSQAEIDDALSRYGYKTGGRVGFSSGGSGTLGDSMQDIKILLMKNEIIEAGGGGFGGKDLDDKTDDEIIEIYEGLFGQGKANGGRIGYKIGGSTVSNFLAKFGIGRPSEEVLDRMFEERKKEIFNSMFDPEAGTGAYSMEQMQKADEMATKQAMQELEEYKMRIGMDMKNPPEGTVGSDVIEQIMGPRKEGRVKEAKGGRIEYAEGGSSSSTEQQKRENYFDLKRDEFMSLSEYLLSSMSDADLRSGKAKGGRIGLKEGGTDDVLFDTYRDAFSELIGYPGYIIQDEQEFGSKLLDDPKFFGPGSMLDMEDFRKERFGPDSPIAKYLKRLPEKKRKEALKKLRDFEADYRERSRSEEEKYLEKRGYMAEGGIMNLKMGGMPAEMDLRGGGFVPIGAKEKADDVPARLSKNEFVMTADAVRAAGGGSVNKGAKRMYDLMHKLEARV